MCSIIGYKGNEQASSVLVQGLRKMEYRGYDSVGIATIKSGKLLIRKGVGKVAEVNKSLRLDELPGNLGIGHTRWATHGGIVDSNAHPHLACKSTIAVVHNGIIENYNELKDELYRSGHKFKSETDSEVIAHLLEEYFGITGDIKLSMIFTCKRLQGSFAFVAMFNSSTLCGARYDEPLIIGVGNDDYFLSSDILGFLNYTDRAIFLDNRDIVILNDNDISFFNFDGDRVSRRITQVAWELGDADKGKYSHYTLKEIHEQQYTIVKSMQQDKKNLEKFCDILAGGKNIYITGSGTSYHSALLAKQVFSKSKIHAETIMSSEFQYSSDMLDENSVLLAISQSGETADVIQSVKSAKTMGAKVISIVNIPTSSLARLSDSYLEVNCGPEIGVAATKSFTSQIALLYYVADIIGRKSNGILSSKDILVKAVIQALELDSQIERIADQLKQSKDVYILGRSLHFPICLEGALKIKELSYIHAEGMAAGELKHGPLALIDTNSIVIVLHPNDSTYGDTLSNIHTIKSRGAKIVGISNKKEALYDYQITIPTMNESLYPLIEVIPLQLLAYHLSICNNGNPDYPRNLAKSVTVK
ncbi:MAG TPA: glutamine--fructose-6-phosphate transaminase (isomerizing) [Nitrososphaeraceae archaeon]|nr:glutamine--fructose-6-phosphate transaminase (isomerizing) [Nitrososphaeraceae archaeon]